MMIEYDRLTQFCPVRRNLEDSTHVLVSRLAALTDRLLRLTGRDPHAFRETKLECAHVRSEIVQSRREVEDHRREHRC